MSRVVEQIIETDKDVTVVVKDENTGYQYSATRDISYGNTADAKEKATQDALDKR